MFTNIKDGRNVTHNMFRNITVLYNKLILFVRQL